MRQRSLHKSSSQPLGRACHPVCLFRHSIHSSLLGHSLQVSLLGSLIGDVTHIGVFLDRVCLFANVDSARLGWVVLKLSGLAIGFGTWFVLSAILTRVVRVLFARTTHDEVESSTSESIDLVADSFALCCGSLALVEPFKQVVSSQTPQEEEACGKTGEEDSREEYDQSDDDHEEGETNGDKQADEQGDDEREDEDGQGEEDEQEHGRAREGNVGEEKGLQCLLVGWEGIKQRSCLYRKLWVLDSKLLELGQELLTALWRKDRIDNGHGFGGDSVCQTFNGADDARHGGRARGQDVG